jgi:hypothetical protein
VICRSLTPPYFPRNGLFILYRLPLYPRRTGDISALLWDPSFLGPWVDRPQECRYIRRGPRSAQLKRRPHPLGGTAAPSRVASTADPARDPDDSD